jgi:hypothetical protein
MKSFNFDYLVTKESIYYNHLLIDNLNYFGLLLLRHILKKILWKIYELKIFT